MFTIREYVKVSSLEEAYELNQKKANVVFGGGVWLRLGKKNIQTAIDLSGLGLDEITEDEKEFSIGCMVSLRQLETHKGIDAYTKGAVKESLRHIVGVQMRNCATVGGSIYGRFGFSDILCCLLGLDCDVELYKQGRMPLADFAKMKKDNDIQTYKEIVAFLEGKRLDEIQKQREIGKRPYQNVLKGIVAGIVTIVVCFLIGLLFHLLGN